MFRVVLLQCVAALLASYFDILFALNGQPHPGEKRLIGQVQRRLLRTSRWAPLSSKAVR